MMVTFFLFLIPLSSSRLVVLDENDEVRYDYGDDYGGFFGGGFPSIFGAPRVRVLVVPVDEVLTQFLPLTCLW